MIRFSHARVQCVSRCAASQPLMGNSSRWRAPAGGYYRLGEGPAIAWLTGGLRRAALGFGFMELLASRYTMVAPDYPAVTTFGQFDQGLSAILAAESIGRFHLVGQSYGGMLAQAYLARHPSAVDRLVLSSTGPADFSPLWLPAAYLIAGLLRLLPERRVKTMLAGRLPGCSPPATGRTKPGWRWCVKPSSTI
jgi:pimeloyl-ACP methyl ester carboxylesterase